MTNFLQKQKKIGKNLQFTEYEILTSNSSISASDDTFFPVGQRRVAEATSSEELQSSQKPLKPPKSAGRGAAVGATRRKNSSKQAKCSQKLGKMNIIYEIHTYTK